MSGAYWFSTMDLMSAYYRVRMREEDIKFTARQAPNGLWEYLVLPMGVCNAPATMHRLTPKIYRNLKDTKSFYDDIYIFTKSPKLEEHVKALRETLDILRENKLYVKLLKYVFCAEEIPCLGDCVGRYGIRMDSDKVQTIKDWPVPRPQEELRSFLGYVQRFCPEYASLTATMFALLKKKNKQNAKIQFSGDQLKNFKELKRSLCNSPMLYLPDFSKPMHLRTDASKFAVGGVLFQVVEGIERPIAYTSRKMKPAEINYPTQQQELLAIIHALRAFRIYCLDKPPIVKTDHNRLEGLFTQKMAKPSTSALE
ncbi:polyprotein [Phytophthora megakarya]|uniref:Polyprotein n=1 Tax=Phytophthora megakarya TaxID=4795 RepID=A0A225UMQ8_9STRA|nr:polyprotein [Phytophthora megakarya]